MIELVQIGKPPLPQRRHIFLMHKDGHAVLGEGERLDAWIQLQQRREGKEQIGGLAVDGQYLLGAGAGGDVHADLRIAGGKTGDRAGDHIVQTEDGGDLQRARLAALDVLHVVKRPVHAVQDIGGVPVKFLTGEGEGDVVPGSVEKPDAKLLLEPVDLFCQRGLGDEFLFRHRGVIEGLRQQDEIFQLHLIHRHTSCVRKKVR